MKKEYTKPEVEKMVFNFEDNVVASNGHKYRLYTDMYYACHETETDIWVDDPTNP